MKDTEHQLAESTSGSPRPEDQLDVHALLVAHEQRKLATYQTDNGFSSTSSSSSTSLYSSRSSLSALEVEEEHDEMFGASSYFGAGEKEECLLMVNTNLPPEKVANVEETYTRQYLFTLPPLYLAVARGNPALVCLLLKYGASVNFQVSSTSVVSNIYHTSVNMI